MPSNPAQSKSNSKRPRQTPNVALKNNEVIVLSSDEDAPPIKKRSAPPRKPKAVLRPKITVSSGEVFEISSEDEAGPSQMAAQPPIPSIKIAELQRQLKNFEALDLQRQREITRLTSELAAAAQNATVLEGQLTDAQSDNKGKRAIPASDLEDAVTCEICTSKMWSPYMLPECGHTFCGDCVKDWFNRTLAQFLVGHPTYNVNRLPIQIPPHIQEIFARPLHQYDVRQHAQIELLRAQYSNLAPEYTCPTCRLEVKTPPAENYSIKAVVSLVAAAQGEISPKKPSHGKPKAREDFPWAAFFRRTG